MVASLVLPAAWAREGVDVGKKSWTTKVVPADQLDAEVDALATQLASSAPLALRGILDAIVLGGEAPIDSGLDHETQVFAVTFSTDDMKEGTDAFLARRKPSFTGR